MSLLTAIMLGMIGLAVDGPRTCRARHANKAPTHPPSAAAGSARSRASGRGGQVRCRQRLRR
jgi:hypothetical protein